MHSQPIPWPRNHVGSPSPAAPSADKRSSPLWSIRRTSMLIAITLTMPITPTRTRIQRRVPYTNTLSLGLLSLVLDNIFIFFFFWLYHHTPWLGFWKQMNLEHVTICALIYAPRFSRRLFMLYLFLGVIWIIRPYKKAFITVDIINVTCTTNVKYEFAQLRQPSSQGNIFGN